MRPGRNYSLLGMMEGMKSNRSHSLILLFFIALVSLSIGAFVITSGNNSSTTTFYASSSELIKRARQKLLPVFPVEGSKTDLQLSGVGYSYNCMRLCHTTYEAADIGGAIGQKVFAADSGEILDVQESSTAQGVISGASLRMKTQDGLYLFYTHMAQNSVHVTVGQHVRAGDILGVIGTPEEAQGAPQHLHFDVSFVENGFDRGVDLCSDKCHSLVAPQPLLRKAYDALPEK